MPVFFFHPTKAFSTLLLQLGQKQRQVAKLRNNPSPLIITRTVGPLWTRCWTMPPSCDPLHQPFPLIHRLTSRIAIFSYNAALDALAPATRQPSMQLLPLPRGHAAACGALRACIQVRQGLRLQSLAYSKFAAGTSRSRCRRVRQQSQHQPSQTEGQEQAYVLR